MLPAAAALLAGAVYLNALENPFVYDDHLTVVDNPSIRDLSNLKGILLYARFRPLVNLSYALDHSIWSLRPLGFHLTSLLLHATNVVLVFFLTRGAQQDGAAVDGKAAAPGSTSIPLLPAFAVAVLLAVHPLMTQAVGYVSGRAEVLCATFFLAAFLALRTWLLRRGVMWLLVGLFFFALALGSKETAASFPFLLLVYDRLLVPAPAAVKRRRLWCFHLPLVVLVVVGGLARLVSLLGLETSTLPRAVWQNALTQLEIIWRYLALLLMPVSQSLVHPAQRVASAVDAKVLVAAVALAAAVGAAFAYRRRAPLLALGWIWFLLALAPSSSFVPLNELMVEHRVYLASVGFFMIVADALARLGAVAQRRFRSRLLATALAVVVVVLGALTVARNRVWADEVGLWRDAARKAPKTWAAHFFLGEALRRHGDCPQALAAYGRAIQLLPEEPTTYLMQGVCLVEGRRFDEAHESFRAALRLDPHSVRAYDYLGRLAATKGSFEEARRYYERALEEDPQNRPALFDLALLHERAFGDSAEALRLCRQVQSLGPAVPETVRDCIRRNEARLAAPGR